MSLPPAFLESLRERLPLSEIAGSRIKLVRAGREHKACCPFHNEKSPSFYINDAKGFFHCFGCGAHGDVIGFVMRHDKLAFPEAIEYLAHQAGLEMPRFSPEEVEKERQQKTLHQLCEATCAWFEAQLHTSRGKEALAYLTKRGLNEAAINRFRLGYAPNEGGALIVHLKTQGFEVEQMVEAGLVRVSENNQAPYSFFRDRVMFPVTDRRGRVVAFGGRILAGEGPKYINSPDNPLFHKGRLLYNLARAREAAPRGEPVIVVEGYMDVITLVEAGFPAAVAPLGTALTEDQIEALWKLGSTAGDPILCFDGDSAGQRAAARAIERVLPKLGAGRSIRFAFLPEGQDPDDLIRSGGSLAMKGVLEGSIPLVDMLWRLETLGKPTNTPESRAGVKAALDNRINAIVDKTVQGYYKSELAARLDEAYGWGRAKAGRFTPSSKKAPVAPPLQMPQGNASAQRQKLVILGLLRQPEAFERLGERLVDLELRGALDKLWQAVVITLENQPGLDSAGLRAHLDGLGFGDVVQALLSEPASARWVRASAAVHDVVRGLSEIVLMQRTEALQAEMVGLQNDTSEAGRLRREVLRREIEETKTAATLSDEEKAG